MRWSETTLLGALTGLLSFLVLSQTIDHQDRTIQQRLERLLSDLMRLEETNRHASVEETSALRAAQGRLHRVVEEQIKQIAGLNAMLDYVMSPEQRWRMTLEHRLQDLERRQVPQPSSP